MGLIEELGIVIYDIGITTELGFRETGIGNLVAGNIGGMEVGDASLGMGGNGVAAKLIDNRSRDET